MSVEQGDIITYTSPSGAIALNTILLQVDMMNWPRGAAIQAKTVGTNAALVAEVSNEDGASAAWSSVQVINGAGPAAPSAVINTPGMYLVPQNGRFLRIRVNTAQTGAVTALVVTSAGENPTFAASHGAAPPGSSPSSNPVRSAGVSYTANPSAKGNNLVQEYLLTNIGQQVTKPYAIPESDWQYAVPAPVTVITDTLVKAAAAGGVRNYITGIQFGSNGVATDLLIKDGATVIWRMVVPANSPPIDIQFPTPLKGTAATAVNVQLTVASSVYFNVQGYIAP